MNGGRHILVTGATGFVGKVLVEELLRRREELGVERVYVVARPKGAERAPERLTKVLRSPCFRGIPAEVLARCEAVDGDLSLPRWGCTEAEEARLAEKITHVLHCAASVEFDLPVGEAASANIDSALNVLAFAKKCHRLRAMVAVSTAYVTPHIRDDLPVNEVLAHLPRPAGELLERIRREPDGGAALLAMTGHPNTYTFTKCVAEHLLVARRGAVPLVIARPSVVSASLHHPMPGWIDSGAAFAGLAMYTGIGAMKVFSGHPDCRLDVVPVDYVVSRVIEAGIVSPPAPGAPVDIWHITAGTERACRLDLAHATFVDTFRDRPVFGAPDRRFMGPVEHGWAMADVRHRVLPTAFKKALLTLKGDEKTLKRLVRADDKVRYMNSAFYYFCNYSFDFQSSRPYTDPAFEPGAYVRLVCRGIIRHVLKQDDTQTPLIGRSAPLIDTGRSPAGPAVRVVGRALEAGLHRAVDKVTVDLAALERAVAAVPEGHLLVLAPNHRSFLDFLILGHLFHVRPGLGVGMPTFAAAEEFGRIPVLGELLRQAGAFYLQRGEGQSSGSLNRHLTQVAAGDAPLLFFVEGRRSRSRRFLPPRRGLLRGLQATGRPCAILPIGLSFDRVPEEADLAVELTGGAKPPMSVRRLAGWAARAARGEVELGRVHVGFGDLLRLDADTDVPALAEGLIAAQARVTWPTTWHLGRFLAHAAPAGVDLPWLTAALRQRGAKVLESPLDVGIPLHPAIERTLVYHWIHWFAPELRARHPELGNLLPTGGALRGPTVRASTDARLDTLVDALAAVLRLPRIVVDAEPEGATAADIVARHPGLHLDDVTAALADRRPAVRAAAPVPLPAPAPLPAAPAHGWPSRLMEVST